jgi:hypothetical protein
MGDAYSIIRDAIVNKKQILATYQGFPREMCPHVIGTKGDVKQALFYQFGGESSSGLKPAGHPGNWRCMPIAELSNVSSRAGAWHTGSNHSRKQTCVDVVDVEATI